MASSTISTKKIKHTLREYIWDSAILRSIFSNPFIVSILILTIIWLIDIFYGKNFERTNTREVIQHLVTTYIAVSFGIVLNNLTIKNKYKKDAPSIGGGEPIEYSSHVNGAADLVAYPQMDQIIAEYV